VAKNFKLTVGEIGPVEIELICSSITLLGAYIGYSWFDNTMGEIIPALD